MPLFSIITVCKNPGASLGQSIRGLRAQSFKDYELVVVDGGSTDGTVEFLAANRDIVTTCVSEPDSGIYDAMNKGIRMAKGELVYFLNCGDDFYNENVLHDISGYCPEGADVVYGDTMLINESDATQKVKRHDHVDKLYLFHRPINHQAIFARRSLFERVGDFNTDYVVKADHEWILRAWNRKARFQYAPVTVARYLLHGFAYQNRGKYRAAEKRSIQRTYFSLPGRMAARMFHRLGVQPSGVVRNIINLAL